MADTSMAHSDPPGAREGVAAAGPPSAAGDVAAPPPGPSPTPPSVPADPAAASDEDGVTADHVRMTLRRVKDPELNLNIVDLGLVYDVAVSGSTVKVDMSLTSPGCPSGAEIMESAERQIREMPGVSDVSVNLVWTPFWSPDRIEPRVRAYLGI